MLYQTMKRFMDIIGALTGLLITAIIYPPTAVFKLDSHGPVICGQERVGKELRYFKCY